jgi:hypothetical protein
MVVVSLFASLAPSKFSVCETHGVTTKPNQSVVVLGVINLKSSVHVYASALVALSTNHATVSLAGAFLFLFPTQSL